MFNLYGYKEVLRNVYVLSKPFTKTSTVSFSDDLREPYLNFLEHTFPNLPINRNDDLFVTNAETTRALALAFSGSTLDDLNQHAIIGNSYVNTEQVEKLEIAQSALAEVLRRDEIFNTIFSLVIQSVFITKSNITPLGYSSHGGSASGAIGSIWLSMHKNIYFDDVMELLVHELIHHLLFLDELVHSHFNYKKILLEENFAYSSILNRNRPLDKVVHSMVVATEVVLARFTFLGESDSIYIHPDSETMLRNVVKSYESVHALKKLDDLLTARSLEIIERCHNTCQSLISEKYLGDQHVDRQCS